MNSLQSAFIIGRLLGRVVILPRFHCNSTSPSTKPTTPSSTVYNTRLSDLPNRGPEGATPKWRRAGGATSTRAPPIFFECPLNALLHMASFDAVFDGAYRENSFLRHPKVPESVKTDITKHRHDVVKVTFDSSTPLQSGNYSKSSPTSPSSSSISSMLVLPVDVTADEVRERLGHVTEKVLTLGQLYDVRPSLSSLVEQLEFDKSVSKAFKRSNYRQL